MSFRATITRRGALGLVEEQGEVCGEPDHVSGELERIVDQTIATMTPGDTLAIVVVHELPAGHPLAGVDLRLDEAGP
jgi:hypothetical protein